jgi:hypothetical protein
VATAASTQEPELRTSTQEEETTGIMILPQSGALMLPPPEREQATNKQNQSIEGLFIKISSQQIILNSAEYGVKVIECLILLYY